MVRLELPLWPAPDWPGKTPDKTALNAECCAEIDAQTLVESWVRHTLVWINRWQSEGAAPLHAEWRGMAKCVCPVIFAVSNWTEGDLNGKVRQAFANGWLRLETFGRVTFVAVTQIEESEYPDSVNALARHFLTFYVGPDLKIARLVALEEIT